MYLTSHVTRHTSHVRWIDNITSEMKCIDTAASTSPASSTPARPSLSGLLPHGGGGGGGGDVKEVELSALYTVFMEVMREKKLLQVAVDV